MSHQIAGTGTKELDFQSQADKQPAPAPAAVQPIAPASAGPDSGRAGVAGESAGTGFLVAPQVALHR